MNDSPLTSRKLWREGPLWHGAMIMALIVLGLMTLLGFNLFGHSIYDSYTLIAQAWRKGLLHLEQNYSHLELAIFNDNYYVSFPSVPALVMWALTYVFGDNTPNTLVVVLYYFGSYLAAYVLARRWRAPAESMFLALFMTVGCSLLQFSLDGGVWNQAQLMSLMLTAICAACMTGDSPAQWAVGLSCLALSVGCRPFQAAFVPLGLSMLYDNLQRRRQTSLPKALLRMIPYLIFPAMVAAALFTYNYARFGSFIEFGHNYLPEHTADPNAPQLALKFVWKNIVNLMRMPWWEDGKLVFPRFNGFGLWLVNPIYVTFIVSAAIKAFRRKWDPTDTMLVMCTALNVFLSLTHKTLGGWHFGARYLCDPIPMMLLFQLRGREKCCWWERLCGCVGIAFNIYGTIMFYILSKKL